MLQMVLTSPVRARRCLKTLKFLITGVLAGNDKLGLVIFDTDVTVVFPLVRARPM